MQSRMGTLTLMLLAVNCAALNLPKQPVVSTDPVVVKAWFGRLGNNIIQVCNAIEIAESRGVPVIMPDGGDFWKVFEKPAGGKMLVELVPQKDECRNLECHELTPTHCHDHEERSFPYFVVSKGNCFTLDERRRVMQTYLKPMFKGRELEADPSELVIHLRGGGMFTRDILEHKQQNQPPCAAYDHVIKEGHFSKVRIVTSIDKLNPCVNEIQKRHSGVTVQSSSILEDFETLYNARNLFVAHSTFSLVAYLMSNKVAHSWAMQLPKSLHDNVCEAAGITQTVTFLSVPHQHEQHLKSFDDRVAWTRDTREAEISAAQHC